MSDKLQPFRSQRSDLYILILACVFPSIATYVYFVVFSGKEGMLPAYSVSKILQFSLPILWIVFIQKQPFDLVKKTSDGIFLGLLSGLAIVGGHLFLYFYFLKGTPVLAGTPEVLSEKLDGLGMNTPLKFCFLAFFISVIHSLLEEYFWRWYVFRQLRGWLGFNKAMMISSLGFMAHHVIVLNAYLPQEYFWSATIPLSICVAIGGAWWCWLYERTGSLWGPWLCHFWADVGIVITGYDFIWG